MPLQIVKSFEPLNVDHVVLGIYGEPGGGKTSMAFSAGKTLLLDFDNGAHRSEFRGDTVRVKSWEDVVSMTEEDLAGYDVIAVDTVGALLGSYQLSLIKGNPKFGSATGLSQQGWGALKSGFTSWLKTLRSYGKDVILIAHDKEEKDGDLTVVGPDIPGGSYAEVFKQADSFGYLYMRGKGTRILDFNPTERWAGKNAGGFDEIEVPNLHQDPEFLGKIIATLKEKLNSMSEKNAEIAKAIDKHRVAVEKLTTADDVNKFIKSGLKGIEEPVLSIVKRLVALRAKTLGLVYEGKGKDGKYVGKQQPKAEPKAEDTTGETGGGSQLEPAGPDEGDRVAADIAA